MKNGFTTLIHKKGRRISDTLILLRDICIQEENKFGESSLLSLDLNKAFDSVDLEYLFCVLHKFGFKEKFINVLRTLYTESETRVLMNGYLSQAVTLERGVRQGDPLSLYTFIIAIEPLLIAKNAHKSINGIMIPHNQEIKHLSYADDITLTVRNKTSI
uniref:secreted RxLR effector protein 78-like n=1 Tax=Styela clava TaxID=7725 RepID=UPI0019397153|nr:secreted RxLR effector protein 78-like [Styela clava]